MLRERSNSVQEVIIHHHHHQRARLIRIALNMGGGFAPEESVRTDELKWDRENGDRIPIFQFYWIYFSFAKIDIFSVYVYNDFAKFLFFKWIISFFVLVSIGLRWNTQLAKLGFTNENAGVEIAEANEQWCARWTDYLWLNKFNF